MNHSYVSMQHHMDDHSTVMSMYLHGGYNEKILFESWTTTSLPLFLISCILLFIVGILYEAIRQLRFGLEEEQLMHKTTTIDNRNKLELELMNGQPNPHSKEKVPPRLPERISLSLLYIVHLVFGYLLMLVVMTFNIYLFLTVILGIGTGHFLFTWIAATPSRKRTQTQI